MAKQLDRVRSQRPRRPLSVELLEVRELLSHGANSVSGEAYGVFADANVAGVHVTVPKTPDVVLPSGGGMVDDQVLCVRATTLGTSAGSSCPDNTTGETVVVGSSTLTVITTGAIGAKNASSQSSATVERVNVLDASDDGTVNGTVTASLVVGFASCRGNGKTATNNAQGSTLLDLSINGVFMGDVMPAPNTTIAIPGGSVILNEQSTGGDGKHSTALTVNMIHVRLTDPITGLVSTKVIVSSAHCDVNFAPVTLTGPKFMTGGGRLGTGKDIATFGFHAGAKNGVPEGKLQYIDHKLGINMHSTSITSFAVLSGNKCVTATGTARVNGVDGYSFTVRRACDNGEPGMGADTFDLSVVDPSGNPFYSRSGTLTGGNLQLHPTM